MQLKYDYIIVLTKDINAHMLTMLKVQWGIIYELKINRNRNTFTNILKSNLCIGVTFKYTFHFMEGKVIRGNRFITF